MQGNPSQFVRYLYLEAEASSEGHENAFNLLQKCNECRDPMHIAIRAERISFVQNR
jgi:hypothetical protein